MFKVDWRFLDPYVGKALGARLLDDLSLLNPSPSNQQILSIFSYLNMYGLASFNPSTKLIPWGNRNGRTVKALVRHWLSLAVNFNPLANRPNFKLITSSNNPLRYVSHLLDRKRGWAFKLPLSLRRVTNNVLDLF